MEVEDITQDQDQLQDELAKYRQQFFLCPSTWDRCNCTEIANWQVVRLAATEKRAVPPEPGIYTLLVQPGIVCHPACSYLMYVGRTNALDRRFGEYLNERKKRNGRPKILRLLRKWPDHTWFCFAVIPEESLQKVEDSLITAYVPPLNDRFPAEIKAAVGAFQ